MRLIDADALCRHLSDWQYGEMTDGKHDTEYMIVESVIEDIQKEPTIEAVPVRHGKWTVTPIYIKCSECGESFMLIPQNYCPNCGARMDEERKEE